MILCGREFDEDTVSFIRSQIAAEPSISRSDLSRRVCGRLSWLSPNGKPKEVACRVALKRLDMQGLIELPAAQSRPGFQGVREFVAVTDQAPRLNCTLAELGGIDIVRIGSADSRISRVWHSLMRQHHYLGSGPLCGAQIRYLIHSSKYGWLGGLAFSAAAWRLKPRDQWIGWTDSIRQKNLSKVVSNSRFLILPQVHVRHLASHVLGLVVRRLSDDWLERYGIEPLLLETFVERDRFRGTCYRAANWEHVGATQGRGRQDRNKRCNIAVKDIYLFGLHPQTCELLCEGQTAEIAPTASNEYEDWAQKELGHAQLRDRRLVHRLVTIARDWYARPQAAIPQACGSRAKMKAAYRFFENGEHAMNATLKAHYDSSVSRIKNHSVVLAVQDTTSLNYSTHPATRDLGFIGSNKESFGLEVHDTMAFDTQGIPLGLIDVQCWARDPEEFGKRAERHELPIEQKESYKWLKSYVAANELQKQCPKTQVVSVGDREADIYELFAEAQDPENAKLLVRARQDRVMAEGQGHVWDHLRAQPLAGTQILQVPRKGKTPSREATLEIRYAAITLKPPKRKTELQPCDMYAVLAQEVNTPQGVEPLCWMLLTTVETTCFEDAIERLHWYATRWGIEVFHKVLKSGCKIEERQLGSAQRIEACLGIDMVVAWRIYHLTKLGRETPDVPCSVYFEEHDWKSLVFFISQDKDSMNHEPTLREAVRMVASLGGFPGRKNDGEPGTKPLWLGLQRLDDIAAAFRVAFAKIAPHLLSHPPP